MKCKNCKVKIFTLLLSIMMVTSCNKSVVNSGIGSNSTGEASNTNKGFVVTDDMVIFDKEDEYIAWESQAPNYIVLDGTTAKVTGKGAVVNKGVITINSAGVYVLSGKLQDGQIVVDTQDDGTVRLVLNGVEINCSNNSPIYIKNASKTVLSLSQGSHNIVSDGNQYMVAGSEEEETKATIYSRDDITINGEGTLNITSNYKDALSSNDELRITGGNILITSKDDAIVGKDKVLIKAGNITINAGGDGIKATNNSDENTGFVAIRGGNIDIKANADGIQGETSVLVSDGNISIKTGEGSKDVVMNNSPIGKPMENKVSSASTDIQSQKGIKVSSDLTISGGTIIIDSYDDAINSNNTINLSGGELLITSGDDGIHADTSINILKGKLTINKSYEGIESMVVNITGGETYVVAMDDGVNVNGGNDGSSVNGRPGQNSFAASPNSKLSIAGGYLSVDALGDGLDSNGSIYITGGEIVVSGPTNDGNGALDYNGSFEMTGGYLVATGSSGMAEAPSDSSAQNSILMYYTNTQESGTIVRLVDSKGNAVVTYSPKKEYTSVVISSPKLKTGERYTLYSGGNTNTVDKDIFNSKAVVADSIKIVDFKTDSIINYLTESGITDKRMGGMGGNKGQFGGRPH